MINDSMEWSVNGVNSVMSIHDAGSRCGQSALQDEETALPVRWTTSGP